MHVWRPANVACGQGRRKGEHRMQCGWTSLVGCVDCGGGVHCVVRWMLPREGNAGSANRQRCQLAGTHRVGARDGLQGHRPPGPCQGAADHPVRQHRARSLLPELAAGSTGGGRARRTRRGAAARGIGAGGAQLALALRLLLPPPLADLRALHDGLARGVVAPHRVRGYIFVISHESLVGLAIPKHNNQIN